MPESARTIQPLGAYKDGLMGSDCLVELVHRGSLSGPGKRPVRIPLFLHVHRSAQSVHVSIPAGTIDSEAHLGSVCGRR